jgi:hypothetical protein
MENISKNKRGRPEKVSSILKDFFKRTASDLKITDRTINNEYYLSKAFGVLKNAIGDFTYLFDESKQIILKKTILYALGRLEEKYGKDVVIEAASIICQEKLNTAQAIDFIKDFRNGQGEDLQKNKVEGALKKVLNIINNSGLTNDELQQLIILIREIKIINK